MNKSIKIFQTYLKKLGKNNLYWDESFMRFLKITDPLVIRRLNGEKIVKDKNDYSQ